MNLGRMNEPPNLTGGLVTAERKAYWEYIGCPNPTAEDLVTAAKKAYWEDNNRVEGACLMYCAGKEYGEKGLLKKADQASTTAANWAREFVGSGNNGIQRREAQEFYDVIQNTSNRHRNDRIYEAGKRRGMGREARIERGLAYSAQ